MGILCRTSNFQNSLKKTNKTPDYLKNYRNEYLFIRGIDKTCGEFVKKLGEEEIYKSPQGNKLMSYMNRYLKAQQLGYLGDTSEICIKYKDVISIESLELQLDDYGDLYCDEYSYEFDEEKYDNNIENDYPGFKKFFECFSRFQDKLNVNYDEVNIYDNDSDSDSDYKIIWSDSDDDSGVDSDDINDMFNSDDESDSD